MAERPSGYFAPIEWKAEAAIKLAQQHPDAWIAWADDDAVPVGMLHGSLSHSLPGAVLIAPNAERGLTLQEAQKMALHVSGVKPEAGEGSV